MDSRPSIFITGAGAGIGRATLMHFFGRGWRVAGIDRDEEALAELRRMLLVLRPPPEAGDRRVEAGAADGLGDGVAAERLGLGVVEGAAVGAADRRARGRDYDG